MHKEIIVPGYEVKGKIRVQPGKKQIEVHDRVLHEEVARTVTIYNVSLFVGPMVFNRYEFDNQDKVLDNLKKFESEVISEIKRKASPTEEELFLVKLRDKGFK